MHDIDRTQVGYNPSLESFEFEGGGGILTEAQEMEMAAELLSVGSEAELEQFLGDLISKAAKAVGGFISSPTGQALGGLLKGAAKKVLPMAGQAIGGYFGGAQGANIGGKVASAASSALGLELEEEGSGEQELETAKNFVHMATEAVKNVTSVPPGANPQAAAKAAVVQAAKAVMPSLLASAHAESQGSGASAGRGRSGRWIRRGSKIVLFGA